MDIFGMEYPTKMFTTTLCTNVNVGIEMFDDIFQYKEKIEKRVLPIIDAVS